MDEKFYEIFRAGNYPQRNVTKEDIKAIAESYDPEFCEAPVSIFHWGNDFAYGWIKELKAEGDKLMASFKDVTDDLKEYVAKKMLKRHSIELYEDLDGKGLYLKGLAMLGKDTPQVKGMEPLQFKEAEAVKYEFSDSPTFANDFAVDHFKSKADALEQEKSRLEGELTSEKQKAQTFATEKEQLAFDQRREKFEAFLDSKTDGGQLEPKLREKAVSLFKHLDSVQVENEEEDAVSLFKDILSGLKKQIKFGEEFTDGQGETDVNSHELAAEISEYQAEQRKAGRIISYSEALNHIKNKKQDTK